MVTKAEATRTTLDEPDMVLFAIFYHDIVYNVLLKDNEKHSALKARAHLLKLGCPNYGYRVVLP